MLSSGLEVAMVIRVSKFLLPSLRWEERAPLDVALKKRGTCREARFQSRCGGANLLSSQEERTVIVGLACGLSNLTPWWS